MRFSYYIEKFLPDRQSQVYAIIILTLLWIGGLAFLFVYPAYAQLTPLKAQVDQAKSQEKALTLKLETITQAERMYNTQTENIALVDDAIPTTPSVIEFVNSINVGLDQFGLRKRALTYDGETTFGFDQYETIAEPPEVKEMSFNLSAIGDYIAMSDFILQLESMPRIASIETVQINSQESLETGVESTDLVLTISGSFYFDYNE